MPPFTGAHTYPLQHALLQRAGILFHACPELIRRKAFLHNVQTSLRVPLASGLLDEKPLSTVLIALSMNPGKTALSPNRVSRPAKRSRHSKAPPKDN